MALTNVRPIRSGQTLSRWLTSFHSAIENSADPTDMDHVARSFDSCPVCTVPTFHSNSGRELVLLDR